MEIPSEARDEANANEENVAIAAQPAAIRPAAIVAAQPAATAQTESKAKRKSS